MAGKTVLITGANSGIGKATAAALARRGARVLMACRNRAKAEAARDEVRAAAGGRNEAAPIEIVDLDLADLKQVASAADAVAAATDRLDVLVNNAGVAPFKKQFSAQGLELQFAVNHLGHFALTTALLPLLRAAGGARVVNVSSVMHLAGWLDFGSFAGRRPYTLMREYAQSKLANVLFARELARREGGNGITANAAHPGPVATEIYRDLPDLLKPAARKVLLAPEQGAETSVYLAASPAVEGATGGYYARCRPARMSPLARREGLARQLWEVSEEMVAEMTD